MSELFSKVWEAVNGFLQVFRRPLFLVLAVLWPLLGWTSGSSPLLDRLGWLLVCSVVGGFALATARYGTAKALNAYTVAAVLVGLSRGAAFLIPVDVLDPLTLDMVRRPIPWNPLVVWCIVAVSSVIIWKLSRQLARVVES